MVVARLSRACIAESVSEYIIASALSMIRSASRSLQLTSDNAMTVDRNMVMVICRMMLFYFVIVMIVFTFLVVLCFYEKRREWFSVYPSETILRYIFLLPYPSPWVIIPLGMTLKMGLPDGVYRVFSHSMRSAMMRSISSFESACP